MKISFCFQKKNCINFSCVLISFILCRFHNTCDILPIFSFISFAISFSCSRSAFQSHLGNNTFKKISLLKLQNAYKYLKNLFNNFQNIFHNIINNMTTNIHSHTFLITHIAWSKSDHTVVC